MPTVWIPPQMRDLTAGREQVIVDGSRVADILDHLDRQFPGCTGRLCDGDQLRPGLAIVVDTQVARLGLQEPVSPNSEVHFLPAIGGG